MIRARTLSLALLSAASGLVLTGFAIGQAAMPLTGPPAPSIETPLAEPTNTGAVGPVAPAAADATAPPPLLDPANLPPVEASATALERIEGEISLGADRIAALKAEITSMAGDRSRQNAALIAAGQRVKLAEIEIGDVEERLDDLIVQEFAVRGRLDGADGQIANVLAALERISLNPPPALIVDPSDALGSARSAILIAAILPQLSARAEQVTADLTRLTEIKASALAEETLLRANFSVLEEEQLRIATLILARNQGVEIMTSELAAEEAEAVALAERATSLKSLVDSLTAKVASVTAAAAAANAAPAVIPGDATPATIDVALANTARIEPAFPIAGMRGRLSLPSNGVTVADYGSADGFGGILHGISIVTRADALVVAPADGWVMYKGPYLNYGQIIILNAGQNYTLLLAGLDSVTVNLGQFVLMGEPVGTMGSRTIGETLVTSAGKTQPTLYIEMRKDNEPVDPTGWWAPPGETTTANIESG